MSSCNFLKYVRNEVYYMKTASLIKLNLQLIFTILLVLLLPVGCSRKDANPKNARNSFTTKDDVKISRSMEYVILINRSDKKLTVNDNFGKIILEADVGIGRGGLKKKKSMSDNITPTGEFVIDLILYNDPNFNKIDPKLKEKYLKSEFAELIRSKDGLSRLLQNMNELDFNCDGQSDRSYGIAYIGLQSMSVPKTVTGPKLRYTNWEGVPKTAYWYSIALHGSPDEKADIGKANSGGCVHLSQIILTRLIEERMVGIGTRVVISD